MNVNMLHAVHLMAESDSVTNSNATNCLKKFGFDFTPHIIRMKQMEMEGMEDDAWLQSMLQSVD